MTITIFIIFPQKKGGENIIYKIFAQGYNYLL